jgi:hypothetical protein
VLNCLKRSLLCVILSILFLAGLFITIGKLNKTENQPTTEDGLVTQGQESKTLGSGTVTYAADVSCLNQEQTNVIQSFVDAWYNALATLDKTSFDGFLADSDEAAFAADALAYQIDMRAGEPLDYSLTSYEYTLTCEDVEENEDGTVFVRALEDSTQHFAAFADVDAQRYNAVRLFTLGQVNGKWTLLRQTTPDTLFFLLYDGEDEDGEDYTDLDAVEQTKAVYRAEMPDYLAAYLAARAEDLAQAEVLITISADHPYDAAAALAYGTQYINTRNDEWSNYSYAGGNCQNFVSQCLYAGGIPMDTTGEDVWKWYGDETSDENGAYGRSPSWTGVQSFLTYAADNADSGLMALSDVCYSAGEAGDTLHVGTAEAFEHATIISQPVKDASGKTVDYLIYSNTSDMRNYPASLFGYAACTITKIVGWND